MLPSETAANPLMSDHIHIAGVVNRRPQRMFTTTSRPVRSVAVLVSACMSVTRSSVVVENGTVPGPATGSCVSAITSAGSSA